MSENKKVSVGVVFGSPSAEHEVSLAGAKSVLEAFESLDDYEARPIGIDKDGLWYTGSDTLATLIRKADKDLLFIDVPETGNALGQTAPPLDYIDSCDYIMSMTLGKYGEDGRLQGFFETLGKEIIGCSVLASSLCFDKAILKATLSDYGYAVTPGTDVHLDRTDITPALFDQICENLETKKLVLKPTDNGSSIGLSQADNFEDFRAGLAAAGKYTNHVLVEKFLPHKEIVVGVIGTANDLIVSDLGDDYDVDTHVYSYEEKYMTGTPCNVPADLDGATTQKIKTMAADIFRLTKCSGWARVDFFIEKGTDNIYVNEVNTVPGMTNSSVFPQIFRSTGLDYPKMIKKILDMSISQEHKKAA